MIVSSVFKLRLKALHGIPLIKCFDFITMPNKCCHSCAFLTTIPLFCYHGSVTCGRFMISAVLQLSAIRVFFSNEISWVAPNTGILCARHYFFALRKRKGLAKVPIAYPRGSCTTCGAVEGHTTLDLYCASSCLVLDDYFLLP